MDRSKCENCRHRFNRVYSDPCCDCILIPSSNERIVSGFKYEEDDPSSYHTKKVLTSTS